MLQNLGGDGLTLGAQLAVGVGLLLLGRRLYWLFVAAVGFIAAMTVAQAFHDAGAPWMQLGVGIVGGILGAMLALFVQRLAVALAGLGAAAVVAYQVLANLGVPDQAAVVGALIAGALGALFASTLFDWALILLSALAGSFIVVDGLALAAPAEHLVMVVLAVAGISFQANMLRRGERG